MPTKRRRFTLLVLPLLCLLPLPVFGAEPAAAMACVRLFEAHSFAEAEACFATHVSIHPEDSLAASYLGRAYFEQRRPEQAIAWLERAVAREPASSEYHHWLGQAYGISAERAPVMRRFALAVRTRKEFERAVELDPGNLDAREDLVEYLIEAPGFLGGSFKKARVQAAEMARRDPLRGQLVKAGITLRQHGLAAAVRELETVAGEFPGDPRSHLALGTACREAKRYEQAFAAFEAALRLDPASAEAAYEFGKTAARSGQRLDRGEELLTRYIQSLPPADHTALARAQYTLGSLLAKRGDPDRARQRFRSALQLDPQLSEARSALVRLP